MEGGGEKKLEFQFISKKLSTQNQGPNSLTFKHKEKRRW